MQASIACVLGLVPCQRNIHLWQTVAPSPVTSWKLPFRFLGQVWNWYFLTFLFLNVCLRHVHFTNTSLLSKRRLISRVHTQIVAKVGVFFISKQALPVVLVVVEVLRDTTWCISATWFGNSRTLASFSYAVTFIVYVGVLITFWSKNFLSMGSNTGKSGVTSFQHMCCAIIVYMLQNFFSRPEISARTAGSHRQLNTDRIYIL